MMALFTASLFLSKKNKSRYRYYCRSMTIQYCREVNIHDIGKNPPYSSISFSQEQMKASNKQLIISAKVVHNRCRRIPQQQAKLPIHACNLNLSKGLLLGIHMKHHCPPPRQNNMQSGGWRRNEGISLLRRPPATVGPLRHVCMKLSYSSAASRLLRTVETHAPHMKGPRGKQLKTEKTLHPS